MSLPISSSTASDVAPHWSTTAGRRETRRTSLPGTRPNDASLLMRDADGGAMNAIDAVAPTGGSGRRGQSGGCLGRAGAGGGSPAPAPARRRGGAGGGRPGVGGGGGAGGLGPRRIQ